MSHPINEQWLESAREMFEGAIEAGNLPLAKDIIADVQDVSLDAGRALNEMLRNTPVSKFAIKSKYPNI